VSELTNSGKNKAKEDRFKGRSHCARIRAYCSDATDLLADVWTCAECCGELRTRADPCVNMRSLLSSPVCSFSTDTRVSATPRYSRSVNGPLGVMVIVSVSLLFFLARSAKLPTGLYIWSFFAFLSFLIACKLLHSVPLVVVKVHSHRTMPRSAVRSHASPQCSAMYSANASGVKRAALPAPHRSGVKEITFRPPVVQRKKVKFSRTRFRGLGTELITVYRQSARR